jgi:hypothetical protein
MSMGDLSTFCCLPQYLSSEVCSSPCGGHPHPLLSLHIGNWFFWGFCKYNCFHIFFHRFFIVVVYDFCKLILYPAILLKLFMVYRNSWVEFFGSLRYKILSSANKDTLTVSLLICIHFISSSCLIALARNSRAMLNRKGRQWTPLSPSWFLGKWFHFFSIKYDVGNRFVTLPFIILLCIHSIPSFLELLS